MKDLKELMRGFGLPAYTHDTNVLIRGGKNLKRWMKVIGTSHPVHRQRYNQWLETGILIPKRARSLVVKRSVRNGKTAGAIPAESIPLVPRGHVQIPHPMQFISDYKNAIHMHKSKEMPQIIREVGFDFHWSSQKVWKLDIPVTNMSMSELQWHFDIPFWDKPNGYYNLKPNEVIADPEAYRAEYGRVMESDLKHPIDIMQNKGRWLILDGLHRLVKAKLLGMDTVKVRKILRNKIPEIQI